MLKRYVLNWVLNVTTDEALRSVRGSEFHSRGALGLKDLPPTVDKRKRGVDIKPAKFS